MHKYYYVSNAGWLNLLDSHYSPAGRRQLFILANFKGPDLSRIFVYCCTTVRGLSNRSTELVTLGKDTAPTLGLACLGLEPGVHSIIELRRIATGVSYRATGSCVNMTFLSISTSSVLRILMLDTVV